MKVKVSRHHIRKGLPSQTSHCPVALAIVGRKKYERILVGLHAVILCSEEGEITYELPSKATEWIEAFDTGQPVQPIEFEMKEG